MLLWEGHKFLCYVKWKSPHLLTFSRNSTCSFHEYMWSSKCWGKLSLASIFIIFQFLCSNYFPSSDCLWLIVMQSHPQVPFHRVWLLLFFMLTRSMHALRAEKMQCFKDPQSGAQPQSTRNIGSCTNTLVQGHSNSFPVFLSLFYPNGNSTIQSWVESSDYTINLLSNCTCF